uniref:Uncharacterized protein n=1 Tax=Brassica oleracea var. oleracea TaxID=109376 RepID=A0A0D3DRT9_BRAOL
MAALTEIPNGDYYGDVPNPSDPSSSLLHLDLRPPCLSAPRLASPLAGNFRVTIELPCYR